VKYFNTLLLAIVLASCNSSPKDLPNFDEATWLQDENGCNGDRLSMVEGLNNAKEQLKGLNQNDIDALLGKPERHELYKRSQKFFYYQISPAKACDTDYDGSDIYLSIRFNATGLAKEVLIVNYQQ